MNDPTKWTDETRCTAQEIFAEKAEMEASTMRKIADVVDAWQCCDADDWRVCRRARRCAGRNNPCFVKHKEEFYSVIRKYILPDLKKRRGQGLYDPGPEVEVVDHGPDPQRHPGWRRRRPSTSATTSRLARASHLRVTTTGKC
jgi:hypothetical protein